MHVCTAYMLIPYNIQLPIYYKQTHKRHCYDNSELNYSANRKNFHFNDTRRVASDRSGSTSFSPRHLDAR